MTNTPLTLRSIFRDAWFGTKGIKLKLWFGIALFFLFEWILTRLFEISFHDSFKNLPYIVVFYLSPLISGLLSVPILTGTLISAIAKARGQTTTWLQPFRAYRSMLSIAVVWFVLAVLSDIGWNIFQFWNPQDIVGKTHTVAVAIAVIVPIFLLFALPLIIDQQRKPLAALALSFQYSRRYFVKIILSFLITYVIIALISFVLMGLMHQSHAAATAAGILGVIVAIWFVPFVGMLYGTLYHRMVDAHPVV